MRHSSARFRRLWRARQQELLQVPDRHPMLGQPITYTVTPDPDVASITGLCIEVIDTNTVIWDTVTGQNYVGIKLRILVTTGELTGQEIETVTYPDMERPVS